MQKIFKTCTTTLFGNETRASTDDFDFLGKNKLSSRLERWLLLTQEFNVHINHTDGKNKKIAHALSRLPRLDDV